MRSNIDIVQLVLTIGLLLMAAVIHEVAHGWVALLCGDDTAKRAGRLTLNPAKHVDPVGSIVLPLVMYLTVGAVFAYAKPVPYNPYKLKDRRRDEPLVALAGPASNVVQALVGALVFRLAYAALDANPALYLQAQLPLIGYTPMELVLTAAATYIWVNLMLCFFNLIPLPPLDGSSILVPFLRGRALEQYYKVQRYSMPILLTVLYLLPMVLNIDLVSLYFGVTVYPLASQLVSFGIG